MKLSEEPAEPLPGARDLGQHAMVVREKSHG
jgi:hypothetical protein